MLDKHAVLAAALVLVVSPSAAVRAGAGGLQLLEPMANPPYAACSDATWIECAPEDERDAVRLVDRSVTTEDRERLLALTDHVLAVGPSCDPVEVRGWERIVGAVARRNGLAWSSVDTWAKNRVDFLLTVGSPAGLGTTSATSSPCQVCEVRRASCDPASQRLSSARCPEGRRPAAGSSPAADAIGHLVSLPGLRGPTSTLRSR